MDQPVGQSGLSANSTYLIYQAEEIGDPQPQNMPGTEWRSTTLKCLAWGLWRQDLPVTNCRLANGQRVDLQAHPTRVQVNIGIGRPDQLREGMGHLLRDRAVGPARAGACQVEAVVGGAPA